MKMRKEKMRNELALAKKQHDFYLEQVEKGKKIMGIKKQKVELLINNNKLILLRI